MSAFKALREVFGSLKWGRPAIVVCPVCRSSKIRLSSRFDVWLMPAQYVCETCGYKGPLVMEIEKQEQPTPDKPKLKARKKKPNQESQF